MLFTHSRVDRNNISIRLGNKTIKQVRSVKFLGIYLDDRLDFNDHVSYLSKKLSKTVVIMYKMSCFLPPHILKMLYFSLFYSQLIYCINVWGGCGNTNSIKIANIQQRALYFFTNKVAGNDPLPYNVVYKYFFYVNFKEFFSIAIANTFLIGSQNYYHMPSAWHKIHISR